MAYPPGLVLHGNTYRVQKRVPQDCLDHYDKEILYFRTEQADKREAAPIAWKWLAEKEAEFERIRKSGAKYKTAITDQEADHLCQLMLISRLSIDEQIRIDGDLESDEGFEMHLDTLAENEQASSNAIGRGRFDGLQLQAEDWLTGHGYELPSEELRRFTFRFAKKAAEANKAVRARNAGEVIETPKVPQSPTRDTQAATQGNQPNTQRLMLSYVMECFLENQDATLPMYKKYKAVLPLLLELLGDKPVSQITQLELEQFFKDICNLPPRWRDKVRHGKTVRQLLSTEHSSGLAPKTFEDTYVAAVRPFIKESKRRFSDPQYGDYRFPYHLTTEGIKYKGSRKEGERKQRAFKPDELVRLFEGDTFRQFANDVTQQPQYWLPLIGLFTGARVNEICQLNPQVDIDTEAVIPFFDFTAESEGDERITKSIKNKTSVRRVPIHPRLIELGFLLFVKAQKAAGAKLLFPQWPPSRGKASAKAEKWFRDFLRDTGLRDETPGKTLLGMHGFRHTFLNRALNLGVLNAEVITGHAREISSTVRGYEGEMELESKLSLLVRIEFAVTPPASFATKVSAPNLW